MRTQNTEHRTQNTEHTPFIIGLTGGIGSGKSYIANGLRAQGYAVYDCDKEAKRIIESNLAVRSQIESLFGSEVYTDEEHRTQNTEHGTQDTEYRTGGVRYNSKVVAEQVFRQPELLQQLNAVVHPAVRQDIQHWARRQDAQVVFVESAILFESGFDALCKAIICVTAPEDVRIERAMKRDKATVEQVEQRIRNQMGETERNARISQRVCASLIVVNDGAATLDKMIKQIEDYVLVTS